MNFNNNPYDHGLLYQYQNCRILWNHKIIVEDLWVRNGKFCNPEKIFFDEKIRADIQIDCENVIIAPGYIDVQINGAFGIDFTLPSATIKQDISKVSRGLLQHGVTSYCPTIITSAKTDYNQVIPNIHRTQGGKEGASILGLHLEGPFISKDKKGAHEESLIVDLKDGVQTIEDMYGNLNDVSIITLAPEIEHAVETIEYLTKRGVVVSLGHSMANLSQGEAAVKAGATFITHLFNAMVSFHHRDPHLVGLLASNSIPENTTLYYGMITDGVHSDAAAMKIVHRIHPKGLVIVTDAVPVMGFSEGTHHFGHQQINIKKNVATIAGTDILCGSISSMAECVRCFYNATECSKVEALEAATLHPAELLRISHIKGTLDYNSDADFVMLDDNLNVKATYIAGEKVWPFD